MSVCGSWYNIATLLLFQIDWNRPVSLKSLVENCYYNFHKDYNFQVWITLGKWFSNINHQGDQLRHRLLRLLLEFVISKVWDGTQEFAFLTSSRWFWCCYWGSMLSEPLFWGPLPLAWDTWGQSRSFILLKMNFHLQRNDHSTCFLNYQFADGYWRAPTSRQSTHSWLSASPA